MSSARSCLAADAIVRSIDADGYVELEFDGASRCAGCAGLCAWRRADAAPERLRMRSTLALAPGTPVRVTLPVDRVLTSALLLHGSPLAALLVGGAAGALLTGSDTGTLAGALAALAAAVLGTRRLRRRAEETTFAQATLEPRR